jgi:hypothetical protein
MEQASLSLSTVRLIIHRLSLAFYLFNLNQLTVGIHLGAHKGNKNHNKNKQKPANPE